MIDDLVSSFLQMAVDALLGYIQSAVGEPSVEMQVVHSNHLLRERLPFYFGSLVLPV